MTDGYVLEIPEQVTIDVSPKRVPQAATARVAGGHGDRLGRQPHARAATAGTTGFPEHLKDQAPRMEFKDGGFDSRIGGKPMTPPEIAAVPVQRDGVHPGLTDIGARLKDLDIEGVEKELIFPQRLFGLYMFGEMQNARRDLRRLQRGHRAALRRGARAGSIR